MPKIVDRQAKKVEIIQAAMKVFARNGVMKSKMIDIARTAGIGKGTIYEYFRSKEEIFAEAFRLVFAEADRMITRALGSTDDPVEKLHRIVHATVAGFGKEDGEFIQIIMDFWAEGIRSKHPEVLKMINLEEVYAGYRAMIVSILEDGIKKKVFRSVNTSLVASVLIAALDGLMLQWVMNRNLFTFEEAADVLLDSVLNGIKRK